MPTRCDVYALPNLAEDDDLRGATAVVIDVLRATTTIVHALAAGAQAVATCRSIEDAKRLAETLAPNTVVLGGERGGLPIPGFDLGNSPEEYTPDRVGGKTVVLTTTNGTAAVERAKSASLVLIGSFVNATAIFRRILLEQRLALICAGTDGQYSLDDLLLAGYLVDRLQRESGLSFSYNAQAITAQEVWRTRFDLCRFSESGHPDPSALASALKKTPGGENLIRVGLEHDIERAARIDLFDFVAGIDGPDGLIRRLA